MIIVSNASPLIILAKISYFHLPQRLFNEITISEDVWDEVVIRGAGLSGSAETQRASQSGWIHIAQLANSAQLTTWRNQYSVSLLESGLIIETKVNPDSRRDTTLPPGSALDLYSIESLARKIEGQTEGQIREWAREIAQLAGGLIEQYQQTAHRWAVNE